jgi:23S rRNA pseudouridine1911/1915/1917 synthase
LSNAEPDDDEAGEVLTVTVGLENAGGRLDKTLAGLMRELSRARLQALIAEGRVSRDGVVLTDGSSKAPAGDYAITVPPPAPAEPEAQDIPLDVLFEDAFLIVLNKPAGMAVHPAPGSVDGTLVNALLHHCGTSLSGVGGVARPGIVHRIDKDTSGVLVVAKTDAAHRGLSKLFAAHDIDREYLALTRGAPHPSRGVIEGAIARSSSDRKKMAMVKTGGRHAVTHYAVARVFGPEARPTAAQVSLTLETGRTHQIRVHLASRGHPCLGDATYGSGPPAEPVRAAMAQAGLKRQALHARVLGFAHPVTGEAMRFEAEPPEDMAGLIALLAAL